MEWFTIQAGNIKKRRLRMSCACCRLEGKCYKAVIILNRIRSGREQMGIPGIQIIAWTQESLKKIIEDMATLYPPREEIKVVAIDFKNDIKDKVKST